MPRAGRRPQPIAPRPSRGHRPRRHGGSPAASSSRHSFQLAFGGPHLPALAINPSDDRGFVGWALRALAGRGASETTMTTAVLEVALRHRFPAAVVRRRDLSGEQGELWYVYRTDDGRRRSTPD